MPEARILVVEDEVLVAQKMVEKLKTKGYESTHKVLSGKKALDFIEKNEVDIVLMDIDLGDGEMDGIDTVIKIKECYSNIPVIYITNYTSPPVFNRAKKTQPYDFCKKNIDIDELSRSIEIAYYNYQNNAKPKASNQAQLQAAFLENGGMFIFHERSYKRVNLNQMIKVRADRGQCILYTVEGRYTLNMPLANFEKQYKHPDLLRINNSFIINAQKVKEIKGKTHIIMEHYDAQEEWLRIGRGEYRNNVVIRFPFLR